ncbi:DUF6382 domain-containing protein [Zhenpiania hominis]|uniref:DUF6382 domain-containing protein n=1 Tax=Zhenpiania hominis TaxID=2763644 RepID=A0A923SQH2_9FIRM|nr:DUF6382 domain-containing protein [Zhenpiania hominis]MBC6679601.1 hypothetical protein [Zhenpiania hominis]
MEIRNNDFKLQLKDGSIKEFEKVVLSSGICDLFMPMGFVRLEDGELVSYNCSGYTALRQCNINEAKEAFEILEKTLLLVNRAGEYLITPGKITLNMDTIFYNRKTKQVRIAYVPAEEPQLNLRENVAEFFTQMEGKLKKTERAYLEKMKTQMEEHNYYIGDLINMIGEIRRKLYMSDKASNLVEMSDSDGQEGQE